MAKKKTKEEQKQTSTLTNAVQEARKRKKTFVK